MNIAHLENEITRIDYELVVAQFEGKDDFG